MDEILCAYRKGKFKTCLMLISTFQDTDDFIRNLLLENCKLMCESYIIIFENDPEKIYEMQEQHYVFFEKVTSLGLISNSIPIQLKLNVTFNFTFWILFYNDIELGTTEKEVYLELINKGLLSVLGKQLNSTSMCDAAGKILTNLMSLKNLIFNEESDTMLLTLELVVVVVVYIFKLQKSLIKECLKTVSLFMDYSSVFNSIQSETNLKLSTFHLFKFNLNESGTFLTGFNLEVFNYLHILESAFLFLLEDFKGSLKALEKNMSLNGSSLWNYLVALNFYEIKNWNLCSKYLTKTSSFVLHKGFKARLHILQGKINCISKKHKEALKEFESALLLSPNCSDIYYYMGQEYGKMGLTDLMVHNFEKLVQVVQLESLEETFCPNFENILLDLLHSHDKITETEALYALAISYGLNESFKNAAETFEKVLESLDECFMNREKRTIELPNRLTILHEASVINLLHGNLLRAEQISLDAIDHYAPGKVSEKRSCQTPMLNRDIEWLQHVIQHDLLETDLEPKELLKETFYSEDLLLFFPQNVIGLLILAEIQRIQEIGEYKATLSKVFSIFSKYLSLMQKKRILDEEEKHVLILVKALAGKTCTTIAEIQIKDGGDSEVEKMFKRSLSCNKGDRDALCQYYKFLLNTGRKKEALKLWKTFFKENGAIDTDVLQSFSLRYLLRDKITTRELEKIQLEVEEMEVKFS